MLVLKEQTELVMFNDGKIKTGGRKPNWFAVVKNTENGREWIKNFREKNRHLKVTLYGRDTNRLEKCRKFNVHYRQNGIRPYISDRIAVYVEKNPRRNSNVKVGERILFGDFLCTVRKVWSDSGDKYLVADSFWDGHRFFAKWSNEKQIWKKVNV